MNAKVLIKISQGDKHAFKQVFNLYYGSLCLFIRKYIISVEHAEDIAQEVFIKIWEKKLHFPNEIAFKSYLYRTAKNMALNAIAHEDVKKRYQENKLADKESDDFFYENYIEQETHRLILQTIDNLPSRAKEVLNLNLCGFKNQEIAKKLNISINTVKNHKASAYKFLKENLKDVFPLLALFLAGLK